MEKRQTSQQNMRNVRAIALDSPAGDGGRQVL